MYQFKILISGAGVAGTCLAFSLAKQGHAVTVIERAPELRASGLQVDLRGHGIEVLKCMGFFQAVREKTVQEDGLAIVDKTGAQRAYFPANRSGKGPQSFTSEVEIMRGDLVQLFYDRTKDQVQYRFGVTIERLEQQDDSVTVTFSDGSQDVFDCVIGADGQHSRTRRMMLGVTTAEDDPVDWLNVRAGYFTVAQPVTESADARPIATAFIASGGRMIMTRCARPHQLQVYLGCDARRPEFADVRKGDAAAEKAAFSAIFKGAGWRSAEILEMLHAADDFYCERPGLVKLPRWSAQRVVLLGDAAFSPTFETGMGTTSAVVGAYILAGEIEAAGAAVDARKDLPSAFERYDSKFRPFMDQVQKGVGSEDGFYSKLPKSAVGIAIMNMLLGAASFLRWDVMAKMAIKSNPEGWSLPASQASVGET